MRFLSALFVTLFCGIFIVVGLGMLYGLGLRPWLDAQPYRQWQTVPCIITESVADAGGPESPPRLDLRFAFAWQGVEHEGTRLRPGPEPVTAHEIQLAAAEHVPGSAAACSFDPADPSTAALEVPQGPDAMLIGFLAVWASVFAGIPLFLVIAAWRKALAPLPIPVDEVAPTAREPAAAGARGSAGAKNVFAAMGSAARMGALEAVPGGYRLAPGGGRIATVVVIGVFAAFWNAVSWGAAISMWSSEKGLALIGLLAFLSIFLGVGLVMIGAFAYQLLKLLFSPRIALVLARDRLATGRPTDLRWTIERGRERLQDLRIDLLLREESSYRRGTDTITDRHEVRVIEAWSGIEPDAAGRCTLIPPADLPPSFERPSNRLVWCLRVRGRVDRLPDVDDEYQVPVDPPHQAVPAIAVDGEADAADLPLSLAEGPVVPAGATVRGSLGIAGDVRLRLLRTATGKGDTEREEACYATVQGPCGFLLTAPSGPPSWAGTVIGVRWTLDADAASGETASLELDIR